MWPRNRLSRPCRGRTPILRRAARYRRRRRDRAADVARRIERVSLATGPAFQGIFVEAVQFPGAEAKPVRGSEGGGEYGAGAGRHPGPLLSAWRTCFEGRPGIRF